MGALRAKASAFDHPKAPHADALAERPFTSAVQILIPRGSSRAGPLTDVSGALRLDSDVDGANVGAHVVAELTLADLLDEAFLARHVRARAPERKSAGFRAVCVDGRIDRDDVAALLPDGRLVLSLTPETYRRFGVPGARSDRGTLKYRCEVNLAAKTFAPGAPFRDRLVECARALVDADPDAARHLYLCAADETSTLTSTSTSTSTSPRDPNETRDIILPAGCAHAPGRTAAVSELVAVPADVLDALLCGGRPPEPPDAFFDAADAESAAATRDRLAAFHEWLGALSNASAVAAEEEDGGGSSEPASEEDGSSERGASSSSPSSAAFFAERHSWEGLLSPSRVAAALAFAREMARTRPGCEWAAVTLWGFAADPTAGVGGGPDGGRRGDAGERDHLTFVALAPPRDGYVAFWSPSRAKRRGGGDGGEEGDEGGGGMNGGRRKTKRGGSPRRESGGGR